MLVQVERRTRQHAHGDIERPAVTCIDTVDRDDKRAKKGRTSVKDKQNTIDDRLDAALEMTFPASDPIALSVSDPSILERQTIAPTSLASSKAREGRLSSARSTFL
jgi:hypothetical protein